MKKLFNNSFENWIFDLDNTIYDIKAGLFVKISERITQYIMEVLSFTKEEANSIRSNMYKKYGLTLTGLMREYEIDPDEYLDFIHDVTHPELQYEKQLKLSLNNLSGKKFIYTNPGIICPVIRYAPIREIKPIIANLPLSFSATIFSFSTFFVSFICLVCCLAKTLPYAILKQI